ncbi:hypothetical protein PS627_01719 [Pseudomonas fluorescens]|uniref:hypothetical protein n=1 Tax=Pseudomonas fluorescens TaxID=294 RepID=UPI00125888E2|nr:hypothetical protein [Pseudomonas fluorescens]CAG8865800.1 hypothetical protein PS627_01719 [Pseudomonas fluorescens]VVP88587.1 hypothetical protein PS910_02662 [Pseudomonas fluorescens]
MNIYFLDNVNTPWGDWGDTLEYGLIGWDEDTDANSIERTGPYTPAAYLCSEILVLTQPIKDALEASGLKGLGSFEPMEKTHIVDLDWKAWDTSRDITEYIDLDDEPEDIIGSRPHDQSLAERMPEYWHAPVVAALALRVDRSKPDCDYSEYLQVVKVDATLDFFTSDDHGGYFISQRAREWLEQHCPGCFTFSLIPSA